MPDTTSTLHLCAQLLKSSLLLSRPHKIWKIKTDTKGKLHKKKTNCISSFQLTANVTTQCSLKCACCRRTPGKPAPTPDVLEQSSTQKDKSCVTHATYFRYLNGTLLHSPSWSTFCLPCFLPFCSQWGHVLSLKSTRNVLVPVSQ